MGLRHDDLVPNVKVPTLGQRQLDGYQQTVPVEEELDLPPTYEEASSSRAARTHGTDGANSNSAIRTPSIPHSLSRHSSLDAEADDALLRSSEASRQAEEQHRQREEQQRRREEQQRHREERIRQREEQVQQREEQQRQREAQREEQQRNRDLQREEIHRHRESQRQSSCHSGAARKSREDDADSDAHSVNTTGYKSTDPMHWEDKARNGDWESNNSEPGCCGSTTGGCCFSSRGGCCFSDRDGCCFSDREGCCFSDRGGCFFSDLDGAFFSTGGGCCFSHHSVEENSNGVRL